MGLKGQVGPHGPLWACMGPSLQHMRPFGPTWPERADPEPRYHHDSTSPTHAISPRSRRQWPPAPPNPTTQNLPAPGSLVEDGQHRTRTHQRSNTSKNEAQCHQEFRRRRRDDATQRYRAANRKIAAHRRPEPKKIETPTTVRRSPRPSRQTPTKPKPGHQTVQPNPRPQQQPQPPTLAPPPPQRPGATNRDPQCFPTRRPGPCRHSQHARTACSPGPKHSTALPPSCTTTDLGTSKARKQSEAAPQKATNTEMQHRRSPQTRDPNGPHGRGHPVDGRTRAPDHPTPGNPNTSTTSAGHPPGP